MGWSVFWIGDFSLPTGLEPIKARAPTPSDDSAGVEWVQYKGDKLLVRRVVDNGSDAGDGGYRALFAKVVNAGGKGTLASIAWEDGPDSYGFSYQPGEAEPTPLTPGAIARLYKKNVEPMRAAMDKALLADATKREAAAPVAAVPDVLEWKRRPEHLEVARQEQQRNAGSPDEASVEAHGLGLRRRGRVRALTLEGHAPVRPARSGARRW